VPGVPQEVVKLALGATLSIARLAVVEAALPATSVASISSVCEPSPDTVPPHGALAPSSRHVVEASPLVASEDAPANP
jgi:hypothetical protein